MPGPLKRIWGWLKSLAGAGPTKFKGRDPRPFLAGQAPGMWASNHLAESDSVKGWNFVAIRTMARMAASAETAVHELVNALRDRRRLERSLRFAKSIGDRRSARAVRRKLERLKASAPTSQGSKVERRPVEHSDPCLKLLAKPNPNWSGSILRYQAIQQLAATGTAILWCVRNELGIPVELYVIPTGLCIPRMPTEEFPQGSYWITPLSSWGLQPLNQDGWVTGALGSALLTGAEVDGRDVKCVRWPHPLYLSDGLSTASAISMWIDVANEMDRACWYGLQNTERPGMVFEQDPQIDPDPADKDQFREDLAAEHAGTPNTGKHLLLPKGIMSRDRGRTPADMDFQNGRPAYRDCVLAAHGVSPVAAGIVGAGSYSQFWAAVKQTTEIAVQPMLDLLAEDQTCLLGTAWPDGRREVNYKARAIDDPQLLESRLATDTRAGNVLLVREYRAMRGLQPFGDERDDAFAGAGMQKATGEGDGNGGGADADEDRSRQRQGDRTSSDDDTGTRQQHRDAPPGRQDRNGKARGGRAVRKDYDPNEARDDSGQWTADGGGGDKGGDGNSGKGGDRGITDHVQATRDREDADVDARHEAERDALEGEKEKAQGQREKEYTRAVRDLDRQHEKESDALDRQHAKEDRAAEKARDKEDRGIERQREKEYDARQVGRSLDASDEQKAAWEAEEDRIYLEEHKPEDEKLEKQRQQEDEDREDRQQAERHEMEERHVRENRGLDDRSSEEDDAFTAAWEEKEDELAVRHEAEDAEIQNRRDAEDDPAHKHRLNGFGRAR